MLCNASSEDKHDTIDIEEIEIGMYRTSDSNKPVDISWGSVLRLMADSNV